MSVHLIRHPNYINDSVYWQEWRDTFEGGKDYRDRYLLKFSERETDPEFKRRKELTPVPSFAKAAVLDIRNSIYQRLVGVTRTGGSAVYRSAVAGEDGGVDGEGSSMDVFIGKSVLTELLVMGKVGVYIDAAPPEGPTLADKIYPPYLTYYPVEDILSFTRAPRGKGGEFTAVLLRDWNVTINEQHNGIFLPAGSETRFRLVWKDEFGRVWFKIFNAEGEVVFFPDSVEDGSVLTNLSRVPFVIPDIGDSLLKDVSSYQQALLNLVSSDVDYAIHSNSPFLTIQRDGYRAGDHLKKPGENSEEGHDEAVGRGKGRYYGRNEARPEYIAPPVDTLEASMKLQDKLEDAIRSLINLAVQSKAGSRTESAESKKISSQGLEAGLSFIGMTLESTEQKIAQIWSEYEQGAMAATVKYPRRYTLKTDQERIEEAARSVDLVERLPGQRLKRLVSRQIVAGLLGGQTPQTEIDEVLAEIESTDYILSDPDTILEAHKAGLVDDETASEALGFGNGVVEQARLDRAERIRLTLEAQTPRDGDGAPPNPAARGAPELDTNPESGAEERQDEE